MNRTAIPPAHAKLVRRQRTGEALFALALLPILVGVLITSGGGPVDGPRLFLGWGVAGLGWALALVQARAGAGDLRTLVVGALVLRGIVGFSPPELSDDMWRYVWEGRLVAEGKSPYAWAPSAAELDAERAAMPDVFERMNHTDTSGAYPPLTQAVHGAAAMAARPWHDASGKVELGILRVLYTVCDLLVLVPLVVMLRRRRRPPTLAVAWAWSPLVVVEFAGSMHFDSAGILFLVAGLAVLERHDRGPGGRERPSARLSARAALGHALLAAAVLVKLLPICTVPFAARGRGLGRRLALTVGLCALAFVPLVFLAGGMGGVGAGLGDYGLRWEWQSLVFRWIEPVFDATGMRRDGSLTDPRRLARGAVGLLWLGWGIRTWVLRRRPVPATAGLIGAFLLLTPTLHPWYVTWMLPFLALRPRASWAWLAIAVPLTYLPLLTDPVSGAIVEPVWLWPTMAVPLFVLLFFEWRADRAWHRSL